MEALPNMPMMAPQFRTSTLSYDNIPNFNFRLRVKEFILLQFNMDPHEYDDAFDELSQLKFEANIPSPTVEQICKLKRYYGQLCMMQKRFPMAAGEQLETPFTWNDGLVDMRSANTEVTINDIEFEKASVMFNIGACHAQYAAEQPRDNQDSIKAAFMHFQYAAYAFEQLNSFRNSEIFYPSVDLDANVISFYYKVLIAQAQECLVQKSLLDNRSAIVIAKLSLWLQEAFDSAANIVSEWCINVPESVQRYYEKMCRIKSDMYGVISYMSLGDHSEKEEKKMGWRLQYYNIAAKYMEAVTLNRKMKEIYPELAVTASFLFDVISAKQKNAEKENDFIYHDRVPKQEEAIDAAKKDGSMCKVKTLSFDPLDASVCGADIFASLLPPEIIESNNKYEEMKDEIMKRNAEVIRSFDAHLDAMLERADFDKLRFMLNEGKDSEAIFEIPDELMRRNADISAYPDCVPNLIEKLRETSDTARVAEAKLNTLIAKLTAIDLPRIKSDEGFILISKELEKLSEHLSMARANNVSLNKAIATHSSNLQVLSLPCNEMWQKIIPEWNAPKEMSPEEQNLRRMVDKVLEMKTQRHALFAQIEATIQQDNISKKLMGTNEERANQIMDEEIGKYSKYEQLIKLNVQAQEAIVRAFADANADFCAERIEMQKAKSQYDQRVADLIASYDVYRDVVNKTDEGEQFYKQLMARCDQFAVPIHAMEEQCRAEMEKKEKVQKEAEQHMQQIRMKRDAQNAMMEFGGAGMAPGPVPPMGPPQMGHMGPPMGPPQGTAGRAPRVGDYLESYRARKMNPTPQFTPTDEPQGPPSPTPSSVCDFPVSRGPQQRMMASPRAPQNAPYSPAPQFPPFSQPSSQMSSYQSHPVSPNPGQFYAPPQPAPGAYQQPFQQYQAPPVQQYQAPPPAQQYRPAPPTQYQSPSPAPSLQSQHQAPAQYQNPAPTHQHPQQQFQDPAPSPATYQQTPQYQPPQQFQQIPQVPSYQPAQPAPATQVYQHQGAPITAPPPSSHQHVPSQFHGYPAQQPLQPGYGGLAPQSSTPSQLFVAPPQQETPAPAPSNRAPQEFVNQGLPSQGFAPPQQQIQAPAPQAFAPPQQPHAPAPISSNGAPQGFVSHGPPAPQAFAPPQQPHAPAPVPSNGAPQGYQSQPFSVPPSEQIPKTQGAPIDNRSSIPSQPARQAAPGAQHFTPTPGAPSPWHATPAELKTPWQTQPQYHAPAPAPAPVQTPAQAPPTAQPPARNNVDLLSDLLGDFNFSAPAQVQPLQPMQNSQNLQSSTPSDFRQAIPQPDPGRPPVATVVPMPQQPQPLNFGAPAAFVQPLETPILSKSTPSVTELSDPSKFQLGEGNVHKLEKRMLHHSIRTNGPPPPLNQNDPLNQIDAFGFARQK